jgi:hypothetical protein
LLQALLQPSEILSITRETGDPNRPLRVQNQAAHDSSGLVGGHSHPNTFPPTHVTMSMIVRMADHIASPIDPHI